MTRSLLALLLLAAGCSVSHRAFDHAALARAVRVSSHPTTEQEIQGAVALRPGLKLPIKLAVWFRPANPWRWSDYRVRWEDEDRSAILEALAPVVEAGIIKEPRVITDSILPGDGVRDARFAAALHEADAVLIVTGATAIERRSTPAALLYPTVVGLWVAPGSQSEGICVATGTIWDVRSGFLYGAAEAEATWAETVPLMLVDEDRARAAAKRQAILSLAQDLERRFRRLGEVATVSTLVR